MTKRILLLQENSPSGDERIKLLNDAGFDVVSADSQDLYWPKYLESGNWHALVFDQSCFKMIFVEMASELGLAHFEERTRLILITPEIIKEDHLPSSLGRASQVTNDAKLLEIVSS